MKMRRTLSICPDFWAGQGYYSRREMLRREKECRENAKRQQEPQTQSLLQADHDEED